MLLLILCPTVSMATGSKVFGALGLSMGNQSLTTSGSKNSKFTSQGYLVEAGMDFSFGGQISAEFGTTNTINSIESQTYMETGSNSYYTAKAGLTFGKFGVGGGYRQNDLKIKSLSTTGPGYLESAYSGYTPLGYMNCTFNIGTQYRVSIEGQYITGALKSSDTTLPQMNFTEMAASLRFHFLFD